MTYAHIAVLGITAYLLFMIYFSATIVRDYLTRHRERPTKLLDYVTPVALVTLGTATFAVFAMVGKVIMETS